MADANYRKPFLWVLCLWVLLQALLFLGKLLSIINWSWWIIAMPILIPVGIAIIIYFLILLLEKFVGGSNPW